MDQNVVFMLSSLVINMNLFPFFLYLFLFPTATTLLMCFIMNTTLRQVVCSSIRESLVLR